MSWQEILAPTVRDVERYFDRLKYRLYYALGGPGPVKVVPYRGCGTRRRVYMKGRVLEERGVGPPTDNDSLWENLVNMYKRMNSYEIPHARVRVRVAGLDRELVADEEGHFELEAEFGRPLSIDGIWQPVELELLEPRSKEQPVPVRAQGEVLVPPPSAEFGVISDIDDTVLQTDATSLLRMARTVFLGNARTRMPFAGAAALYRALHAGRSGNARNPLFYVSNSPWNLYDLLSEFFQLNDIPIGPVLFLRNWGVTEDELLPTQQQEYKLRHIRRILDLYPELPFILIGDSGEEDPEVYHHVTQEYPDRVLAIYIRNVSQEPGRPAAIRALTQDVRAAGSTLVLSPDSVTMARHAAAQGWILDAALASIQAEKARDEAPAGPLEEMLQEIEPDRGDQPPPVIVSSDEGGLR
jgi:phosphatidate phosphatase APP1